MAILVDVGTAAVATVLVAATVKRCCDSTMMNTRSRGLDASFDRMLKLYLVLQVAVACMVSVVGLVVLPLWLVVGPVWVHFYFPTIQARLTERSLTYSHGVFFRREMSVPLDKIQDLSLLHGPLLDMLGLCTLKVDTAGGGQTGSAIVLTGVRDAVAFREAVIARRDALTESPKTPAADSAILEQIRDALLRIEARLDGRR